jgi:hypothetical protein
MTFFSILSFLFIQTPSATPNPGDSSGLDLSNPFDLIVYIILPIAIFVFYLLYRKQNRKK